MTEKQSIFLKQAKDELSRLKRIKEALGPIDEKYLDGTLDKRKRKDGWKYYHRVAGKKDGSREGSISLLGGSHSEQVKIFIRTRIYKILKKRIEANELAIKKLIDNYQEFTMDSCISELSENCKELVLNGEYLSSESSKKSAWESEEYNKNPMQIDNSHRTITGELVRSKGEALIYDYLTMEGIPFRYECELEILVNGVERTVYPDFTIPSKYGNNIYIEYSGMVGQSQYLGRLIEKLKAYYQNGITLNQNLFLIFDDNNGSIDMESVYDIIKYLIKPRAL